MEYEDNDAGHQLPGQYVTLDNPEFQDGDPLGHFIEKNMPAWEQRQANYDTFVNAFRSPSAVDRSGDARVAADTLRLSNARTDHVEQDAVVHTLLAKERAATQRNIDELNNLGSDLAAERDRIRAIKNMTSFAESIRVSGMTEATGDPFDIDYGTTAASGSGLRVGSSVGVKLQATAEGLIPSDNAIDSFARGFGNGGGDWSVLEGDKPLSYSLGGAVRAGFGLVYDGLTGAGDFRAASQAATQGGYVNAVMYGLRGIGTAGMTALTLGEYALAKASVVGAVRSIELNAGTQVFRGGAYGRLDAGPGIHRHHMPANSVNPMTTYSGPAIQMEVRDHLLTSSHGAQGLAGAEYRAEIQQLIQSNQMRKAMSREIWDVRRVAVEGGGGITKYNSAIREMVEYSHSRGLLGK